MEYAQSCPSLPQRVYHALSTLQKAHFLRTRKFVSNIIKTVATTAHDAYIQIRRRQYIRTIFTRSISGLIDSNVGVRRGRGEFRRGDFLRADLIGDLVWDILSGLGEHGSSGECLRDGVINDEVPWLIIVIYCTQCLYTDETTSVYIEDFYVVTSKIN